MVKDVTDKQQNSVPQMIQQTILLQKIQKIEQTSASLSKSKYRFLDPLLPTILDGCDSTGAPYKETSVAQRE